MSEGEPGDGGKCCVCRLRGIELRYLKDAMEVLSTSSECLYTRIQHQMSTQSSIVYQDYSVYMH